MLKGNLSTRPFYNEGLVNLLLVIAAIAGVALTVFNVTRATALSQERATFTQVRDTAAAEAATINANADRQKKSVDQSSFFTLGFQTQEANSKIDERRFSWTVFFGLMEKTLPLDARLIAVAPRDERGTLRIDLIVNGKTPSDISAFLDALRQTGSFYDVYAAAAQTNDDGSVTETVASSYVAPQAPQPAKPAPNGKGTPNGGRP
jgi:Tfp pilus assembly protein PilN